MRREPSVGTVDVRLIVAYGGGCIGGRLAYDVRLPLEVRLVLRSGAEGDEDVIWIFARDLLVDGVKAYSGIGDVRVWPFGSDRIGMSVHGAEGDDEARWADMVLPRERVMRFLARSFDLVPRGEEPRYLHLDAELANFLAQS